MHFLFPGRTSVEDLADEVRRVASLLQRNGVEAVYNVRLRLSLLNGRDHIVMFKDELGDDLEVLEVPPLRSSLTGESPADDAFAMANLEPRPTMLLSLCAHASRMRSETGPDRGPAALDRVVAP